MDPASRDQDETIKKSRVLTGAAEEPHIERATHVESRDLRMRKSKYILI